MHCDSILLLHKGLRERLRERLRRACRKASRRASKGFPKGFTKDSKAFPERLPEGLRTASRRASMSFPKCFPKGFPKVFQTHFDDSLGVTRPICSPGQRKPTLSIFSKKLRAISSSFSPTRQGGAPAFLFAASFLAPFAFKTITSTILTLQIVPESCLLKF